MEKLKVADISKASYKELDDLFAKWATPADVLANEDFMSGNHFKDGAYWIGYRPPSSLPPEDAANSWNTIVRNFAAENVVGAMVARLTGAIIGKSPDFSVTSEGSEDFRQLNEDLLNRWWERAEVHEALKTFVRNKAVHGPAALRIYIPAAHLNESGQLAVTDVARILSAIKVEVVSHGCFIKGTDSALGNPFTAVKIERTDNKTDIELSYLTRDGNTVIKILSENEPEPKAIERDISGLLLHFIQGSHETRLITPTIVSCQKSLNHALTGQNLALANINFPEMTFFNAQEFKAETKDSSGKVVKKVVPPKSGPGVYRFIKGLLQESQSGSSYTTPQVHVREGADPQKFEASADSFKHRMYSEAGMLYLYLADSEYASGNSKIESMTDYLILLTDHKTAIDQVGTWLIRTVTTLVAGFANLSTEFDAMFATRITIGRVTPEEKSVMLEEVRAGLRSQRSYMIEAAGFDDPDAERAAMEDEPPLVDTEPKQPQNT